MGRSQIRKNQNRNKNVKLENTNNENSIVKSFIIVVISIVVVFGGGFLILSQIMEPSSNETVEDYVEPKLIPGVDYTKILAQDSFKKKPESYVVFYINGDEGYDEMVEYRNAFNAGEVLDDFYVVDMSEGMNTKYLVDDTEYVEKYGNLGTVDYNKDPKKISELEIYKYPTALAVTKGKSTGFYEGSAIYEGLGLADPNAEQ